MKAPRITEAAARSADQARDAGWTHEDYRAAVLEHEVSWHIALAAIVLLIIGNAATQIVIRVRELRDRRG